MSSECDENIDKEFWKPKASESCPFCKEILYISSIISQNGQVNFGCTNKDCPITGFIFQGRTYISDGTYSFRLFDTLSEEKKPLNQLP